MEVSQLYSAVNVMTAEEIGDSVILNEDLSNIMDFGDAVFNANALDNFVNKLVNQVGRMYFESETYTGSYRGLMMDSWEFGSVAMQLEGELSDAEENESWNLRDRESYDPNIFYQPKVTVHFWNNKQTFEIPYSITRDQIKESFQNAEQLNAFVSMILVWIANSMEIKIESLAQRMVNTIIAEIIYSEYDAASIDYGDASGVKAINLLYLYNTQFSKSLKAEDTLYDQDFLRFFARMYRVVVERMAKPTKLYNLDGKLRFTPKSRINSIMLADYQASLDAYLQADVWHNEYTKIAVNETIPCWQGTGTAFGYDDITNINITTPKNHTVDVTGVIGVVMDRKAAIMCNTKKYADTYYNPKGRFYSTWNRYDMSNILNLGQQAVVFFVAEDESA